MGNSPQFSNTNMKFQRAVGASDDNPGQKVKVSIWLNFDNGWDDEMKRPHPPTESQQKAIEDIHKQIKDLGMELSVQLQGENQMNIARTRAFYKELRYETKDESISGFDDL